MASSSSPQDLNQEQLRQRAQRLKLFLLDVDGVLTDGGIVLSGADRESKKFDVQDGMGVTLIRRAGVQVGILTGRVSEAVRRRAEELEVDHLYQGHFWKDEALEEIVDELGIDPGEMAYVGDDVLDLCVMKRVSLPLAPSNARPEVKRRAVYVASEQGGGGAVREIVDWLLELRGEKRKLYRYFAREIDSLE